MFRNLYALKRIKLITFYYIANYYNFCITTFLYGFLSVILIISVYYELCTEKYLAMILNFCF